VTTAAGPSFRVREGGKSGGPYRNQGGCKAETMGKINELIMDFSCRFAEEVGAKAILLSIDVAREMPAKIRCQSGEIILISRGNMEIPENIGHISKVIRIPDVQVTRMSQIKIAITKGISAGYFTSGDRILCLTGVPRFGYVDTILVIDVGREFEILTSSDVPDIASSVSPEVFEAVLNIALELAAQGREGRPAGTIFVLGDHEKVLQLSRQMIINPFQGYREEERNILDPALRETVKEFSAIDGAFIIRDDGVLLTAGRHLSAALESKDFPKGLGSRHIAAAGITGATHAIAIVISESTGSVRVFKGGKIFVEIEKAIE